MLTGKPPYSNMTKQTKEILRLISTGSKLKNFPNLYEFIKEIPTYPLNISPQCREFLDACLKYKPEDRLKASELQQMSFLTSKKKKNRITIFYNNFLFVLFHFSFFASISILIA